MGYPEGRLRLVRGHRRSDEISVWVRFKFKVATIADDSHCESSNLRAQPGVGGQRDHDARLSAQRPPYGGYGRILRLGQVVTFK